MAFLLEESTLDAEQKGYLDAITQSGEMLLRVLSDILDISKVEGGDFSISADPFVAQDLVGSVTHLFEGKARQGGNTLIGTVEPPEPIVLSGDAGRNRPTKPWLSMAEPTTASSTYVKTKI